MTDKLTPERRSQNMRRIKSTSTKPELIVRKLVYGLGYRFRLHAKELPGKPDIVFRRQRKAIFVHGCFWHSHPDPKCRDARVPKSNTDYWLPKLARNVQRDAENVADLKTKGWQTLVIWECQTKDLAELRRHLHQFLG
jgi:DNA mismatch endonuclease (patch repair protein)